MMKLGSALLVFTFLVAPESSWAFHSPVSHSGRCGTTSTTCFGFRQSYQYSLEQYTKTGKIEINGKQVDPNEAVQTINEDLQASQDEVAEAQQRLTSIEEQISDKVQERTMTMEAFQAEIEKTQLELEAKYKDMNEEAILAANNEKKVAMEEFQARELQLQKEMDQLYAKLEDEKNHVRQNQDMTNRILATRIELDTELGILKKKYTTEAKEWETKLQAEKAARANDVASAQAELERLQAEKAARANDAASAQAEVERLKREVEEMSNERNSLGSLFKQSMKVMFGLEE